MKGAANTGAAFLDTLAAAITEEAPLWARNSLIGAPAAVAAAAAWRLLAQPHVRRSSIYGAAPAALQLQLRSVVEQQQLSERVQQQPQHRQHSQQYNIDCASCSRHRVRRVHAAI
jgi:hypothetical protein